MGKYEIARAVIDGRGLLAVHINGLRHHQTRTAHSRGPNPLAYMAVARLQNAHYLFEWKNLNAFGAPRFGWGRYDDYTFPVKLPRWLGAPSEGHVVQLSNYTAVHDYVTAEGHKNIGAWIDWAAQAAER